MPALMRGGGRRRGVLVALGVLLTCGVLLRCATGAPAQTQSPPLPDVLQMFGRDQLALCVEGLAGAEVDATGVARVRFVLWQLALHLNWWRLGYGRSLPQVDLGCPIAPPKASQLGMDTETGGRRAGPVWVPQGQPGLYTLYLFVVPAADVQRLFPTHSDFPRGEAIEYSRVSDGVGVESATAIYLTPDEFGDMSRMRNLLGVSLLVYALDSVGSGAPVPPAPASAPVPAPVGPPPAPAGPPPVRFPDPPASPPNPYWPRPEPPGYPLTPIPFNPPVPTPAVPYPTLPPPGVLPISTPRGR